MEGSWNLLDVKLVGVLSISIVYSIQIPGAERGGGAGHIHIYFR